MRSLFSAQARLSRATGRVSAAVRADLHQWLCKLKINSTISKHGKTLLKHQGCSHLETTRESLQPAGQWRGIFLVVGYGNEALLLGFERWLPV
ncbi:hypothetical protein F2P79_024315 [Pimephales promelas]|nr:hypothetical protein F2P79_024315 [Pimephales promelas]